MQAIGLGSIEEIGRLTLWEYGVAVGEWVRRNSDDISPPSADEYYAEREALMARNDPSIRLH